MKKVLNRSNKVLNLCGVILSPRQTHIWNDDQLTINVKNRLKIYDNLGLISIWDIAPAKPEVVINIIDEQTLAKNNAPVEVAPSSSIIESEIAAKVVKSATQTTKKKSKGTVNSSTEA